MLLLIYRKLKKADLKYDEDKCLCVLCLEQTSLPTEAREPEPVWPFEKSQAPWTQQLNFQCRSVWGWRGDRQAWDEADSRSGLCVRSRLTGSSSTVPAATCRRLCRALCPNKKALPPPTQAQTRVWGGGGILLQNHTFGWVKEGTQLRPAAIRHPP